MVNVIYVDGNSRGSTKLEEFFDEVAHEETISIFCSFLMDKYDPLIYDEAFYNVCATHATSFQRTITRFTATQSTKPFVDVVGPIMGLTSGFTDGLAEQPIRHAVSSGHVALDKRTKPHLFCEVRTRAVYMSMVPLRENPE